MNYKLTAKILMGLPFLLMMNPSWALTLSSYLTNDGGSTTDDLTVKYQNCSIDAQGTPSCESVSKSKSIPDNGYTEVSYTGPSNATQIYTVIISATKGGHTTSYSSDPTAPNACASPVTNVSMTYGFDFKSKGDTILCYKGVGL